MNSLLLLPFILHAPIFASDGPPAYKVHCEPDDPKNCVVRLSSGSTAPFSGVLLTYRRGAKAVDAMERCHDLRTMDLEEQDEKHQIELGAKDDKYKSLEKATDDKIEIMMDQMKKMGPKWYERPPVVATLSVLGTIAVTVSLYFIAVETLELQVHQK